ncbi:MAG: DUF4251 domain-containing protein [Bacteroidales bacterium]|nr:DUF4251 domain-containing protein [Bacteroidales bacterium]
MKKLIVLSVVFILAIGAYCQTEVKTDKKAAKAQTKEQKKEEKQKKKQLLAEITKQMVESQRFVLEASFLLNRQGKQVSVDSRINFIIIDSTDVTFQFGDGIGGGLNGVGGATFDGKITKYQFNKIEKKKYSIYNISFVIFTTVGVFDVTMAVTDNSRASATIRDSRSGMLKYEGTLYPHEFSRIYKAGNAF